MSTRSSNICQNCNTKSESTFKYCPNCGQKNTDGKITFSEIWSEFQNSVLNIDSRTWRTFKYLFIPGKLTLEYFSGKHRQYVHPLRMLIVSSILFVIAMSFQDFQSLTNHGYDIKERMLKNYERTRLFGILGNIVDSTNAVFPEQQTEMITDTIMASFRDSLNSLLAEYENARGDGYGDTIDLNRYLGFSDDAPERISKYDFLNKHEDELLAIYKKDAGSLERFIFKQRVKHIKDESKITEALIGHTTWAALLMMPCLALVLYFLNIRHNYYYIEHLIFTFHFHSFAFLVLTVLIAGLNLIPWWMLIVFMGIIWIYVFIAMRRVYKQSAGKTLFKFIILSVSYGGFFILFLLGTIIFTFFLL